MRKRHSRQQKNHHGKNIFFTLILVVLSVFLILSIVRLRAKYLFVKQGHDQLQEEVDTTQAAINRMESSLEVLETPEGTQRVLKEEFRVLDEGEELIIIVPDDV